MVLVPVVDDSSLSVLIILSLAQLFGLSLWFVTNSVIDQLIPLLGLDNGDVTLLSISVTLGFVVGGLVSTLTSISDIVPANRVFMISSIVGGTLTIAIVIQSQLIFILLLRFLTGVCLAGIYPVGMKLTASHYRNHRGLAIGTLLSALTIGSGLPYVFLIFGSPSWQLVMVIVGGLAMIGGLLGGFLAPVGPHAGLPPKFSLNAVRTIFSRQSVRWANLGYLGHMWDLYAFWVWYPRMLKASLERSSMFSESQVIRLFGLGSFLIFLAGGLANVGGGYLSDRIGRTRFNIVALALSGSSSIVIGLLFNSWVWVLVIGLVWGIAVIPDSPQYSSIITEVSDQSLVGSALAIQTAMGFLLTIVSIYLIPLLLPILGWSWVFTVLSIGPVVGIFAMYRLRTEPDAIKIAGGLM